MPEAATNAERFLGAAKVAAADTLRKQSREMLQAVDAAIKALEEVRTRPLATQSKEHRFDPIRDLLSIPPLATSDRISKGDEKF
jgi:hypothetical protein